MVLVKTQKCIARLAIFFFILVLGTAPLFNNRCHYSTNDHSFIQALILSPTTIEVPFLSLESFRATILVQIAMNHPGN